MIADLIFMAYLLFCVGVYLITKEGTYFNDWFMSAFCQTQVMLYANE